jgi:hypothetical protein
MQLMFTIFLMFLVFLVICSYCDGSYGSSTDRHETYGLLCDSVKDIYSSLALYPLSSIVLDSQIYSLSSTWAVAQLGVLHISLDFEAQ